MINYGINLKKIQQFRLHKILLQIMRHLFKFRIKYIFRIPDLSMHTKSLLCLSYLLAAFISVPLQVYAQEKLEITFSQQKYQPGDTLTFRAAIPAWEGTKRLGTLNILIEDINHQHFWRVRYPIVDGFCEASLFLPPNFPQEVFAMNFQVQPTFFQLNGKIQEKYREDSLRYTLMLDKNQIISGKLPVSAEGEFRMPRHMFSGNANLYFAGDKPVKGNNTLDIKITTPLDSVYIPLMDTSILLAIGKASLSKTDVSDYAYNSDVLSNDATGTLKQVIITGTAKTPVKIFEEKNTSGYFKAENAYTFSGLDGEFSGFVTILDYLQGRVAGLNVVKDTESFNSYLVSWRNEPTAFFVDELPVDLETIYNFPPSEIAILKVYRPPFMGMILGASGGAIAIYSKRATLGNSRYKNKFVISGFSPISSTLKIAQPEND